MLQQFSTAFPDFCLIYPLLTQFPISLEQTHAALATAGALGAGDTTSTRCSRRLFGRARCRGSERNWGHLQGRESREGIRPLLRGQMLGRCESSVSWDTATQIGHPSSR